MLFQLVSITASYANRAATDAGKVADMAASRKEKQQLSLSSTYIFQPIAVEHIGAFSYTTLNFISELDHQIHGSSLQMFVKVPSCFSASLLSLIQCFCTTL